MKKYILLLILGLSSFLMVNAQKENGIVYSEHEAITKTNTMWAAFVKGDKETFASFFADSIREVVNGDFQIRLKKDLGGIIDWWKAFEGLGIQDDKPAFPDAIDYKNGGLWVQDWLLMKGTHKATGINLKLRVHNLYQFDKNGKIKSIHQYFNNDIFDEIYKNERTIESGIVYKYHPYIITIRKAVNAYCAKDLETLLSFYTPDAVFSSLSLKDGEVINLEAKTNEFKNTFADYNTITLDQSGNPVCVCYEKEYFVVYSWWVLSVTTKDGKKMDKIPVMLTHGFNKDGKITWEAVYLSSNHFQ